MKVLPAAPAKMLPLPAALEVISPKLNVWVKYDKSRIPIRKNISANRVTIKAFFDAAIASGFV